MAGGLREPQNRLPAWIVLKMSTPASTGDLWHTLVLRHTQPDGTEKGGPPMFLGRFACRTIVLLSIDDLRRESAWVDGSIWWERAAIDLVQELRTNPRLQSLKKIRFVVVRFGLGGAFVVDRDGETERHLLVFDPATCAGAE